MANYSGDGNELNYVGGLVGRQDDGLIIASYATGNLPYNGTPKIGKLIGEQSGGTAVASYGFGAVTSDGGGPFSRRSNTLGTPPSGVTTATGLTASNAGSQWNATASDTRGAWHFGTASQTPALQYADYDGSGSDYSCSMFPTGKCNTIIPGQGR